MRFKRVEPHEVPEIKSIETREHDPETEDEVKLYLNGELVMRKIDSTQRLSTEIEKNRKEGRETLFEFVVGTGKGKYIEGGEDCDTK